MNSPRAGLRVAAFFFGIICLGHTWRLLAHVGLRIGGFDIPRWPSVIAVFGAGFVCLWLWRLSGNPDRP